MTVCHIFRAWRAIAPCCLFAASLFAPVSLRADAIASVTVQTDTTGQPGGGSCVQSSSGAQVVCTSGYSGFPSAVQAGGSASAGLGALSINIGANASGPGSARATASANYSYELLFPGQASGSITGEYAVAASAAGNFGIFGNIGLFQGSTTAAFLIEAPAQNIPDPVTITSVYTAGQPLKIAGNMSASASTPGEEAASATVRLIGFFDPAGNAIPFVVAPEPAYWPVLGVCLAMVWRRKRLRLETD